jgi:hypothetical protein
VTGWDEHGHARTTGLPVDRHLGAGDLQDAENCGYAPVAVLAELGVDYSLGDPQIQFRDGRIVLTSGVILVRGGTLNSVWAVDHRMTCGCLVTANNVHRGDCPEWVPQDRAGDWRGWTWIRREVRR